VEVAERVYVTLQHATAALRALDQEIGLTPARSSALGTLRYRGPLRLGELARAEGVTQPTMTQLVHGMAAAGLVRRDSAADDGRGCIVALTPLGRSLVRRARARKIAWVRESLAGLDPSEAAALDRAARSFDAAASASAG
jgi:DNA-binding MarR family transcriptional regulator